MAHDDDELTAKNCYNQKSMITFCKELFFCKAPIPRSQCPAKSEMSGCFAKNIPWTSEVLNDDFCPFCRKSCLVLNSHRRKNSDIGHHVMIIQEKSVLFDNHFLPISVLVIVQCNFIGIAYFSSFFSSILNYSLTLWQYWEHWLFDNSD